MRSIDAQWDEDEVVDLGGKYLYQVQYGQSHKQQVKSKQDPQDKYGYARDVFNYYKPFVDGKLDVFYEDRLASSFWFKDGCLHNPYGPAKLVYRKCGNMVFEWVLNDKRFALRADKIVSIGGSIRMGERRLHIMKQGVNGCVVSFLTKEKNKSEHYFFRIYDELINEYKKH